jgi:hypothetical protein
MNAAGPVPLVLDLRLAHDRFGSNYGPTLNGRLHLLLVRMDVYIVTLSDFYFYRLIGKLTAFLQLQEFSQWNQTWELRTSTFAARLS